MLESAGRRTRRVGRFFPNSGKPHHANPIIWLGPPKRRPSEGITYLLAATTIVHPILSEMSQGDAQGSGVPQLSHEKEISPRKRTWTNGAKDDEGEGMKGRRKGLVDALSTTEHTSISMRK